MAGTDPTPGNELKIKLSVSLLSFTDLPLPQVPKPLPKPQARPDPIYLDLERTARGWKTATGRPVVRQVRKRSKSSSDGEG